MTPRRLEISFSVIQVSAFITFRDFFTMPAASKAARPVQSEESGDHSERALEDLTKSELVKLLIGIGVENPGRFSKIECIALLKQASSEGPSKGHKQHHVLSGLSRFPKQDLTTICQMLGISTSGTNGEQMLRIRLTVEDLYESPIPFGKMKGRLHYQIVEDLQSSYRKWCLEEFARAGPLESSLDFQRLVALIKLYSKHFPTETPPKAVPVKPEQLPKGWPVEPDAPNSTPGRGIKKEEVKSEARGSTEGNLFHRILRRQQARPVSPDKVPVGTGDSSEELLDDSPPCLAGEETEIQGDCSSLGIRGLVDGGGDDGQEAQQAPRDALRDLDIVIVQPRAEVGNREEVFVTKVDAESEICLLYTSDAADE